MAASKKVNPDQFRLFWPASELIKNVTYSTDSWNEDTEEDEELPTMWSRKEDESRSHVSSGGHGAGVYDSMAKSGYRGEPVTISHVSGGHDGYGNRQESSIETGDGHHRIAAAAALEREGKGAGWVHVENYDYTMMARDKVGRRKGVQSVGGTLY